MILIISDKEDRSTWRVAEWLHYYKADYMVITSQDSIEIVELYPDGNFLLKVNDEYLKSENVESVWYRRGEFIPKEYIDIQFEEDQKISNLFRNFNQVEQTRLFNFIHNCFFDKVHINNYLTSDVNKMLVLKRAQEAGLIIPKTIVVSEKKKLLQFKSTYLHIITKPAITNLFWGTADYWFSAYTEEVDEGFINNLPDNFYASLFQERIDKVFEIRAFFLNNVFYAMAIFSQLNDKTKIDFRHYDSDTPNRTVPFQLPQSIQDKLIVLMNKLKINCGSIDLLYGTNKKFYFLEVNPIGQFGMTSIPCNYYLEKLLAQNLIKSEKENRKVYQ